MVILHTAKTNGQKISQQHTTTQHKSKSDRNALTDYFRGSYFLSCRRHFANGEQKISALLLSANDFLLLLLRVRGCEPLLVRHALVLLRHSVSLDLQETEGRPPTRIPEFLRQPSQWP